MADEGRKRKMQRKKGANLMKNLFKKIGALLVAAVMVLSMCTAVFAAVKSATITVNNLDVNATISYLEIIVPDQTTETGWAFANGAAAKFHDVRGWAELTDQQIIWKLIKFKNANAKVPSGTEAATASQFQAAMTNVETLTFKSDANVKGNEITANTAGVYAIKATTTDTANYAYSPMAAFVSFKPYTGAPAELKDETVNAKRTTIKIEKSSNETDGVVEINKEVTYTVRTNVPYISDAVADDDVRYTITDTIEGADYSVNADGKVVVSVQIGAGAATNKTVDVTTLENGKKQFVLDLSDVAKVRANANAAVVISYKAIVKSEVVNNSVVPNDGTHTFTPKTNTLYTGKIIMTKTDDSKEKVRLANAGFVIYRVDGAKTYYALVSKDTDTEKTNNEYVVTDWTESLDTAKADTNLIMTDSNGEAVVRGLDDSYTYNFKEIKAPEGYSVNTTDSVATWGTNQTAENRTGTATMNDTKLNSLPSTGGMGTYLFTIIGVVVMAGAAGAFFISRRKGSEE